MAYFHPDLELLTSTKELYSIHNIISGHELEPTTLRLFSCQGVSDSE